MKSLIPYTLLISISFLMFCDKNRMVPFSELHSYFEVSIESENEVVFRAFTKPNSFQVIGEAKLVPELKNNDTSYYIVLLYGKGNQLNGVNGVIKKMPWGGIKVTFSNKNLNNDSKVYYIDSEKKYKVKFGNQDSWKKHIEELFQANGIDESQRSSSFSEI